MDPENKFQLIRNLAALMPENLRAEFEVQSTALLNHPIPAIRAEAFVGMCLLYAQIVPAANAASQARAAVQESTKLVNEVAQLAGVEMVKRLENFNAQILPGLQKNIAALTTASSRVRRQTITWTALIALVITALIVIPVGWGWGLHLGYRVGVGDGAAAVTNDIPTRQALTELELRGLGLAWKTDARLNDRSGFWRCLFITGGKFDTTFTTAEGNTVIVIESAQIMPPLPPPAVTSTARRSDPTSTQQ